MTAAGPFVRRRPLIPPPPYLALDSIYGISVYTRLVHTVIETPAFLASARDEGLGEDERVRIVTYLQAIRRPAT